MKLQCVTVAPDVALCYYANYVDYPCERDEHKHNGSDKRDYVLFVKRAHDTVNAPDMSRAGMAKITFTSKGSESTESMNVLIIYISLFVFFFGDIISLRRSENKNYFIF